MIGGMLRVLVVALVALVAVMMLTPRVRVAAPPAVAVATVLDAPRELPAVELVDQHGAPFRLDALAGRHVLLFFGFTHCPDVCPLTLAALAEATGTLATTHPDSAPAVLFISVDPERDSPERIRNYLRAFNPDFVGATADAAALAPLYATLGVTVHQERQGDAVYNVVHNGTVYVLDDAGRWLAIFGGSSHRPGDIVSDYLAIRARPTE